MSTMIRCGICEAELGFDEKKLIPHNMIGCLMTLQARVKELRARIAELEAYADKLAAGLPEGMLPKDIEIIREANWKMAQRIAELEHPHVETGDWQNHNVWTETETMG